MSEESNLTDSPGSLPTPKQWYQDYWFVAMVVILLLAAFLRFYNLETKPMAHDEGLYAYYSWRMADSGDYKYDPLMHGPFMFYLNGMTFILLGESDFTARLPVALMSLCFIALAWMMKDFLGKAGAITAVFFLAFSPAFLYYARYLRHDTYMLLFTLMPILFFIRFWYYKNFWDGIVCGASLALMFCVKENSYMHCFIFVTFLTMAGFVYLKLWNEIKFWICLWSLITIVIIIVYVKSMSMDISSFWYVVAIGGAAVVATLIFSVININKLFLKDNNTDLNKALDKNEQNDSVPEEEIELKTFKYKYFYITALFSILVFWFVYLVMYTKFFTQPEGFLDGLYRKSIMYWMDQNKVQRLDGPFTYYIPLLLVYNMELLLGIFIGLCVVLGRKLKTAIPYVILVVVFLVTLNIAVKADQEFHKRPYNATYNQYSSSVLSETFGLNKIFTKLGVAKINDNAQAVLNSNEWTHKDVSTYLDKKFHIKHCRAIPIILFITILGVWMTIHNFYKKKTLLAFFWYWFFMNYLLHSYAGEKVPWLLVHVLLPLVLVFAHYINDAFVYVKNNDKWQSYKMPIAFASGIICLFVGIFVIWNGYRAAHTNEWNPNEMMVHVQTTPDYTAWMKVVNYVEITREKELKRNFVAPVGIVAVCTNPFNKKDKKVSDRISWPGYWFLKHTPKWKSEAQYSNVIWYFDERTSWGRQKRLPPIIMFDSEASSEFKDKLKEQDYVEAHPETGYELRAWWIWADKNRTAFWNDTIKNNTVVTTAQENFWDYFFNRKTHTNVFGSSPFTVFVKRDLYDELTSKGILPKPVQLEGSYWPAASLENWKGSFINPEALDNVTGSNGGL